ncbi:MAG: TolB family protein [Candidatus Kapaibacterium sp.]
MLRILIGIFLTLLIFVPPAQAQLWHALPALSVTAGKPDAQFSNDGKKVFYSTGDGNVENIWSVVVADKYGRITVGPGTKATKVTSFFDRGVVRFFHLLGSADLLYMRATDNGKDYHIFRIADDGSGAPLDITPDPDGVTNIILGASYNGRYIYYTSNKVNRDKTDVYRYDAQQYTSEDVFPNDKDYVALAWSRDQTKLLMQRPSTGELSLYDMETTERDPIALPNNNPLVEAILDPVSQDIIVLQRSGVDETDELTRPFSSGKWKTFVTDKISSIDFSPGGKYEVSSAHNVWKVKDRDSNALLPLPGGTRPIAFAPKGTLLLYTMPASDGTSQLYLYDIPKNSSTLLGSIQ